MALTSEQKGVFGLALEILETGGAKAMDHTAHAQVQSSSRPGQRPAIDWAVEYVNCLKTVRHRRLVVLAHLDKKAEWSDIEIRQCGAGVRWFYVAVQRRRLYGEGVALLERTGGA